MDFQRFSRNSSNAVLVACFFKTISEAPKSGIFFFDEGQPSSPKLRPVRLVLEHFKPKLHDLFRSFARRQLPGPTDAKVGSGTTRLKERTIWKQTQELLAFVGYP